MAASMKTRGHKTPTHTFVNLINFRDVGETVNDFLGRKILREGVIYRSARPDDATREDRKWLKEELGIKTVMDLRTKCGFVFYHQCLNRDLVVLTRCESRTEHLNAAKKYEATLALPPVAHATSNVAAAEPLQIPGISYLEIKLTGKKFERHLLSQLSWWSYIKLISLFAAGLRMRAIAILGREVMLPRGLVGLATDTLDQSGPEILEALQSFLKLSSLPMLIHCTQGKDRTGIIVILLLMILDVPTEAIDFDYQLSEEELLPEREARLVEIREIGLTEEFADTAKDLVEHVSAHLKSTYGGLEGYLDGIGFDKSSRTALKELFAR